MAAAILRAHGFQTGLYTSPHLVTFRERTRLGDSLVPESEIVEGVAELQNLCARMDEMPTFFELTTALALRWFMRKGAEYVVLETGLGGRLDATNVMVPAVCGLTPVGLDHMEYLGDTLEAIAGEKAGILKSGIPTVSAPQASEVREVFDRVARDVGAPLRYLDAPWGDGSLALEGAHQLWNAALAVALCAEVGFPLRQESVRTALATVDWPGRFQKVRSGVWVDGAHNSAAAVCLAEVWRARFGERRARLVIGVLREKDVIGFLSALAPIVEEWHLPPVRSPRARSPDELAAVIGRHETGDRRLTTYHALEALRPLFETATEDAPVLVTGSLYLVGEIITLYGSGGTLQQDPPSAQ
jgi:dihydrofolate synthase/folylpolyglutamate synthase